MEGLDDFVGEFVAGVLEILDRCLMSRHCRQVVSQRRLQQLRGGDDVVRLTVEEVVEAPLAAQEADRHGGRILTGKRADLTHAAAATSE